MNCLYEDILVAMQIVKLHAQNVPQITSKGRVKVLVVEVSRAFSVLSIVERQEPEMAFSEQVIICCLLVV